MMFHIKTFQYRIDIIYNNIIIILLNIIFVCSLYNLLLHFKAGIIKYTDS